MKVSTRLVERLWDLIDAISVDLVSKYFERWPLYVNLQKNKCPEVMKIFPCSTHLLSIKFQLLIKSKKLKN